MTGQEQDLETGAQNVQPANLTVLSIIKVCDAPFIVTRGHPFVIASSKCMDMVFRFMSVP